MSGLTDPGVVDAIGGWARVEAAACARKHAAMAELFDRRTDCVDAVDRDLWWVDPDAAIGAEIGAAQNISSSLALFQTHRAVALRDRLPRVAALFAAGQITDLLVRVMVSRTSLITDPEVMAKVDVELAAQARRWGPLSARKTETAIDAVVEQFDAGAVRRARTAVRGRRCRARGGGGGPPRGGGPATSRSAPSVRNPGWPRCRDGCSSVMPTPWISASRRWRSRCATTIRAPWGNGAPTPWPR